LRAPPLTMDHITRHHQALMDLTRQEQQDTDLKRELQSWPSLPLDRQIQLYESNSKTARRDQVMTQTSLIALMTALPSIEQKRGPNAKNNLQSNASSAEHVKFYHEHQAEIGKLRAELVEVVLGKK